MPGFCIYAGELINQLKLIELLQSYETQSEIMLAGNSYQLLDKILNFSINSEGTIKFDYQWDEPQKYNYRGETKYLVRTYYLHTRIVLIDHLYILLEKRYGYKNVSIKLSQMLYASPNRILTAYILSDLIKDIELRDSSLVENEWFEKVSSKDQAVGVYGKLNEIRDDGSRGYSELHERFMNRDRTASRFLSMSREARIYISAKKSSVTLRGLNGADISLNDVEIYIRDFILPRVIIRSSS